MTLQKFREKEDEHSPNMKRPYVHESVHNRVDLFATRNSLTIKEAYRELVFRLIDKDGKPHPEARRVFRGEFR